MKEEIIMARKPLGKDKFGVQKVMRIGDYFGDSLGQFALNAMSGLVGQLTFFYTDKVGLAAAAVGTLFFLSKIVDAFTDLIMGNIVDHTAPGKERYRPWLLKGGIPGAIMILLLFTVPNVGDAGRLAYMFVTNLLLTAVFYTAICIPYSSLMVVRTNSQEERGTMGTWRAAAGYVSGMIIVIATIPVTNMLGGTQEAWIKYGAVFALFVALCFLICYKTSRETASSKETPAETQPAAPEEESLPFMQMIGKLFRNKYWVMVLIANLCANVSYGLSNSSGTYYAKWIYGDENLVGILGAVGMIPTLVGFILVTPMIKKLGVTKTLRVSFLIGVIANALRLINPTHFVYNTTLGCFSSFANIPMMCLMGVMTAMTIDYNEYQHGIRMVACSQSASSFGCKIGNGLGASMVAWLLGLAGYLGAAATELTPAVRQAIYGFSIYVPLALFVIMLVISLRFDLEARLPGIRQEIAARKSKV